MRLDDGAQVASLTGQPATSGGDRHEDAKAGLVAVLRRLRPGGSLAA